jgi:isopenicillin N synthase-like dioxygenase
MDTSVQQREAPQSLGFVYITNHTLPDSVLGEAFEWSRRFFALSPEDKLKAPHPEGWAVHRGYSWPGLEKVSQAISDGNDEELVKKLREVTDFKVRTRSKI